MKDPIWNEKKKKQAEKLGAVVSHDAPLAEPGEGASGEHMLSVGELQRRLSPRARRSRKH